MCIISKQILATVTLPQPEPRPQPLCLLFILGRVFISPGNKFTGDRKTSACQVPIHSVFSSLEERREQLEGRSLQQPCQMPAMFIEENARIPSSPERGSFWETIFPERWENMHRIQRCSRLVFVGKNDSWCPCRGVNYKSLTSPTTWISTEAGFWILWGEEATWPGSPTLLDASLSARNYWYSSSVPPFHYVFQAFCLQ